MPGTLKWPIATPEWQAHIDIDYVIFRFLRDHRPLAGSWWTIRSNDGMQKIALMCCPKCGTVGSLKEHEITPIGIVRPKVMCVDEVCGFDEWIMLDSWMMPTEAIH